MFFENDVMVETTCELSGTCNVDQRSFKAYQSRWMGYTAVVASWTRDLIDPKLRASATAAAAQCTGGANRTSCDLYWAVKYDRGPSFGVGEQMAAVEVIQSLLYPTVAGPATQKNGGTSSSSPDAGLGTEAKPTAPGGATAGERIAGSVLTIVMLASTIAGAYWLLSGQDEQCFRQH